MSRNRPPYRLESIEDVNALYGQSQEMRHRWLLLYANENVPVKPQALSEFPERIDLVLQDVKTRFRRVVQDLQLSGGIPELAAFADALKASFEEALAGAPDDYFEMTTYLYGEWYQSAFNKAKNPSRSPKGSSLFSDKLQVNIELQERMADLLKVIINTKNKQARSLLVDFLMRLSAYDPKSKKLDADLVRCLMSHKSTSTSLLAGLNTLFVERIGRLKENLFDIHFHKLKELTVHKVNRCLVPFPFKTKIVSIVNAVRSGADIARAEERLGRLIRLSEGRIPAHEMQKVKDIVIMYLKKVMFFESFFADTFHMEKIRQIYETFCRPFEFEEITETEITNRVVLHLYPTKDYHDFLKGIASGDCSAEVPLAAQHMASPRFFNIRIFRGSVWGGNIYMLDYMDRDVLIVDRIQIRESKELLPLHFVHRFMSQMLSSLKISQGVHVLGPSAISNFKWIQKNYEDFRCGRKRTEFRLDETDRHFDSYRQSKFYVLS